MGAWIALRARREGWRTTLIDAFGAGHARATSGDETRIIRVVAQRRPVLQPLVARGADGLERPGRGDRRAPVRAGRRPVARPRRGRLGGVLGGDAADGGHPGRATLPGRPGGALAADALGRSRVRDLRARGRAPDGAARGRGRRAHVRRRGRRVRARLGRAGRGRRAPAGRCRAGRRPPTRRDRVRVRRRPVAAAPLPRRRRRPRPGDQAGRAVRRVAGGRRPVRCGVTPLLARLARRGLRPAGGRRSRA